MKNNGTKREYVEATNKELNKEGLISIYQEDIQDLRKQLDEIWKAVRELLAKLAEIQ